MKKREKTVIQGSSRRQTVRKHLLDSTKEKEGGKRVGRKLILADVFSLVEKSSERGKGLLVLPRVLREEYEGGRLEKKKKALTLHRQELCLKGKKEKKKGVFHAQTSDYQEMREKKEGGRKRN